MKLLICSLLLQLQLLRVFSLQDNVRPGFCPQASTLTAATISDCQLDTECTYDRKCCINSNNVRECAVPEAGCRDNRLPVDNCPQDQCPSYLEMVSTVNWKVCCKTTPSNLQCQNGMAPLKYNSQHTRSCAWNSKEACPSNPNSACENVAGHMVCCPVTVNTVQEFHGGFCPEPTSINNGLQTACFDMCYDDSKCQANHKCCSNLCNARICVPSVTESTPNAVLAPKPGACPAPSACSDSVSQCGSDLSCPDNDKCCKNAIGVPVCSEPTAVARVCPDPVRDNSVDDVCGVAGSECVDNSQCPLDQVCCGDLNYCRTKRCVPIVTNLNQQTEQGCPTLSVIDNLINWNIYECNNRHDCRSEEICCLNTWGRGKCVKPTFAQITNLRDGICPPSRPFTDEERQMSCVNEYNDCPVGRKCCPDHLNQKYCVSTFLPNPLSDVSNAHQNMLINRNYTLQCDHQTPECKCEIHVDRDIVLTPSVPITSFRFFMYNMQDILFVDRSTVMNFPAIWLQLWRPVNAPGDTGKKVYALICQQQNTIESVGKQLLYEIEITETCFTPLANDKVGFLFDGFNDASYPQWKLIEPVLYDYDSGLSPMHGTDRLSGDCHSPPNVGNAYQFDTYVESADPYRYSFGVVQNNPETNPNIP